MTKSKIVIGIITCMAILSIPYVIISVLNFDEKPLDDSHLRREIPDIPPEKNAFTYLEQLPEVVGDRDAIDGFLGKEEGVEWDQEAVERIIEANAEGLDLIRKMLECEQLVYPEIQYNDDIAWLGNFQGVSHVMRLKALSLHRKGEHKAALDEIVNIIRASRMMADGFSYTPLMGTAAIRQSLSTISTLLTDSDLEADALLDYARALEEYRYTVDMMVNVLKADHTMTSETLNNPSDVRLWFDQEYDLWEFKNGECFLSRIQPWNYFYQPIRTRNEMVRWNSLVIDAIMALPDREHFESAFDAWYPMRTVLTDQTSRIRPNVGGRLLLADFLCDYSNRYAYPLPSQHNSITQAQTLLALKAYQIRNGDLPETLDALVPEYLPTQPIDEFDGQPMRYSRERKIIWSVGRNMQDDGGDPDPMKDIVLEIPF